jgi:hypothetical protein
MKNTIFKIALAILLVSLIGTSLFGQTRHRPDTALAKAGLELKGELRDWAQAKVIPQMKTWKLQLDAAMEPADLGTLNGLRTRAAENRSALRVEERKLRTAMFSRDRAAATTARDNIKRLRAAMKTMLQDELKPLAVKYKATLELIGKDAKTLVPAWKKEAKAIGKAWFEKYKDLIPKRLLRRFIEKMGALKMLGEEHPELFKKLAAARLMLYDGNDLPPVEPISMGMEEDQSSGTTSPEGYSLNQNYPNPFNPTTNINFTIPKAGNVTLKVYDLNGKEIATLVNAEMGAGTHAVSFDASKLASGTYIYKIVCGDFVSQKRMSLVK